MKRNISTITSNYELRAVKKKNYAEFGCLVKQFIYKGQEPTDLKYYNNKKPVKGCVVVILWYLLLFVDVLLLFVFVVVVVFAIVQVKENGSG